MQFNSSLQYFISLLPLLFSREVKFSWPSFRTRDRIEFTLIEDRTERLLVVTARESEGDKKILRTIFLDLEVLYSELQFKSLGHREPIMKKQDSAFSSDTTLDKATKNFVFQRLNIGNIYNFFSLTSLIELQRAHSIVSFNVTHPIHSNSIRS